MNEYKARQTVIQNAECDHIESMPMTKTQAIIIRPQRHFALRHGWINDPNGLVWFRGRYHLYFQCNPYGNEWGKMHWGHAVSKDLIHWEECVPSLIPDHLYENYQRGGCFSGSVIVHKNRLYAFYTAVSMRGGQPVPAQCIAYSDDGYTFVKPAENPIIPERPCESHDFRDPKVIFYKDRWQMIVGGSSGDAADLKSHGRIYLYHSLDLFHWNYDGILYEAPDGEGTMFECPDLFEINGKWIITASPMNRTDFRPTVYMTGVVNFKNCLFCKEYSGTLDYGPHFYASQVYYDRYRQPVSMAWLGGWEWMPWIHDHGPSEKNGYRGILSYPRLVSLDENGRLRMKPYINAHGGKTLEENDAASRYAEQLSRTISRGSSAELVSSDAENTIIHLQGVIEKGKASSAVTLSLCDEDEHRIELTMDFLFGNIIANTTGADVWTANGIKIFKSDIEDETVILFDLLRDGNVLEIFLFDGKYNYTSMIYPTNGRIKILITAKGAPIRIRYSITDDIP
ncbi:glycoside hydrolase family 32 protein [Lachnoclostridium sp. Marseille-P6806]|uniref:glycoside hydrolase family 32 protein n=1 Tax=Lachnoclostridium sp. Marseille-P6806 TaxID=2364793 RepID=UPI001F5F06F5|nr:glycoside hydrolase family 32 protein [Lachnoclostridium sp. Marseille-P6806]